MEDSKSLLQTEVTPPCIVGSFVTAGGCPDSPPLTGGDKGEGDPVINRSTFVDNDDKAEP